MGWLQRLGPEAKSVAGIHDRFLEMLVDGRHIFDAAANALLGGTDPEVIREDLFATDSRINRTEQMIRRAIVVHGTVHGASTFPELLVMMSLVKDAERIGDYAKNLFDLAAASNEISPEERAKLVRMKDLISKAIVRAHGAHEDRDQQAARELLAQIDGLQDECDEAIHRLCLPASRNHAAEALTQRYFKRVLAHVGNVATALVMPLDKLDYFDEPKPRS